jgi:hypothetical protein
MIIDTAKLKAVLEDGADPAILSDDEVEWLENRVFELIAEKMLNSEGRFTFAQHETLQ